VLAGAQCGRGGGGEGLDRAKAGVMMVVTVVVYPIDEFEDGKKEGNRGRGDVDGLGGRGCAGSSFQDLLFCHQTLPRPLITN